MLNFSSLSAYEILSLIISSLGFLAVTVTIIVFTQQAKELAKTTKEQTLESLRSHLFDINRIFLDNPDLRPYFYEGKKLRSKNKILKQRLQVVSENLLDAFEIVVLHHKHFQPVWEKASWESYMIDLFRNSPLLSEYMEKNKDWFPKEVYQVYLKAKNESP